MRSTAAQTNGASGIARPLGQLPCGGAKRAEGEREEGEGEGGLTAKGATPGIVLARGPDFTVW